MALQMVIKMEGVEGDSKSFYHKGWSEVLSWNWGMTSNRKSAQASDADKTSLNELSIIKPVGSDSPGIRLMFAQGKIIPSVEFNILPVVGKREAQSKYLHMMMEGVVIKSIVCGGSSEDNFFKEHITLLFDRVSFEFSRPTPAGANAGHEAEAWDFGWNVPSNSEWQH